MSGDAFLDIEELLEQSSTILTDFRAGLLERDPGPTEYVVNGIIVKGVLNLLDGLGGVGKSFGGMQLCGSIVSGAPFLGEDDFAIPDPGLAAYLTTEDHRTALARRYRAMRDSGIYTPEQIAVLDKRLILIPWGDEVGPALSHVDSRGQVTPTEAYDYLRALLETTSEPIKYIHLDPAVDLHGGEGFKPNEIRQFCNLLKRLITEFDTTICINHHLNKSGTTMGSIDWTNACRNQLRLTASDDEIRLTNEKRNDDAKFLPIVLRQSNGLLEFARRDVERDESGKFSALPRSTKDDRILIVIKVLAAQPKPYTMAASALKGALHEQLGLKTAALEAIIKSALEDSGGLVNKLGRGPATTYYHANFAPFVHSGSALCVV